MKKLISITFIFTMVLLITSCKQKTEVNIADAPKEVKEAFAKTVKLSKELTELQLKAGSDSILDAEEIAEIGKAYRTLAIVNNINYKLYSKNKYYLAMNKAWRTAKKVEGRKEKIKSDYDKLADTVAFLKDCKGYDEFGLAIQKISLEVKDVTVLPVETPAIVEDTVSGEEAINTEGEK